MMRFWRRKPAEDGPGDLAPAVRQPVPIALPTDFDEDLYLKANPDVASALEAGIISSGAHHYSLHGHSEHRALVPGAKPGGISHSAWVNSRREKILANLDLHAIQGVEIGALNAPLVSLNEGNIFYVDHVTTETLKEKYRDDPNVDIDKIVEVHGVWGEQNLAQCLGEGRTVDYVVASHVIEHCPDLITWLAEIKTILKSGGSLRLAIPDRRFTFDYLRFETRIHDVLDAYLRKARTPLPRQIIEFFSYARVVNSFIAWEGRLNVAELPRMGSPNDGMNIAQDALLNGNYHDVHCWVFTPLSFAEVCIEMAKLDLLGFELDSFLDTSRNEIEFFVQMTASDDKDAIISSWSRMRDTLEAPACP